MSTGYKATMHHFDGSSREVMVNQKEFPYPSGQLIISRVDLEGKIIHINKAFIVLSGYTEKELIGAPHALVRHPDMPKAAFKDLWETVQRGEKWRGYVKNLRKDGQHYWVYATVVPNYRDGKIIGYTSVRREASRDKIEHYTKLYEEMCRQEAAS